MGIQRGELSMAQGCITIPEQLVEHLISADSRVDIGNYLLLSATVRDQQPAVTHQYILTPQIVEPLGMIMAKDSDYALVIKMAILLRNLTNVSELNGPMT